MKRLGFILLVAALTSCSTVTEVSDPVFFAKDVTGSVINSDVDFPEQQALLEVNYKTRSETLLTVSESRDGNLKMALLTSQGIPLLTILAQDKTLTAEKHVPAELPFSPNQIVNDCLLCSASFASIQRALPKGWTLVGKESNAFELRDAENTAQVKIVRERASCSIENLAFGYRIRTIPLTGDH